MRPTSAHAVAPLLVRIALAALAIEVALPAARAEEDVAALFREAEAHENAGQWSLASSVYHKIMDAHPENALAHYRFGTIQDKLGASDLAMRAYREAVRLDPTLTDARRALEGHFITAGKEARRSGQRAAAREAFEQALEANPTSVTAHLELGEELERQGDLDRALQVYRKATAADPQDATAHRRLGALYARQGLHERAAREFQEALGINPRNADAHRGLGVAYAELGQRDKALAALRQAIRFYVIAGAMDEAMAVEELERKLMAGASRTRPPRALR